MAKLTGRKFTTPDETRKFEHGQIDIVNLGGVSIGLGSFNPGWRWSEHVRPIAHTPSCQANHVGYMVAGKMHVSMNDGTEAELVAGDAVHIPPGHDAWVVGSEPCLFLDVMGMETYAIPPARTRAAKRTKRASATTKRRSVKRKARVSE